LIYKESRTTGEDCVTSVTRIPAKSEWNCRAYNNCNTANNPAGIYRETLSLCHIVTPSRSPNEIAWNSKEKGEEK